MSGTMGESTSKRLANAVRAANAGRDGAVPGGPVAGGKYYGGWGGGAGGTWARAATGRSSAAAAPAAKPAAAANPAPGAAPQPYSGLKNNHSAGRRPSIRPNTAGTKAAWDTPQSLPKAPAKGGLGGTKAATRPRSAATRRERPLSAIQPVEYQMSKTGLNPTGTRPQSAAPAARRAPSKGAPPFASPYRSGGIAAAADSSAAVMAALERGALDPSLQASLESGSGPFPPASAAIQTPLRYMDASPDPAASLQAIPEDAATHAAGPVSVARILQLENAMRAKLKARRSVYEDEKALLLKAFKAVDDGSGDVSADEFVRVMTHIGVQLQPSDAHALFHKYGCKRGSMAYEMFVKMLLSDKSRQLAQDVPLRKGAFAAGDGAAARVECKVSYYPSKKPVYTPSDWAQPGVGDAVVARSSEVPDSRLQLEFVYGYAGADNTSANVFYNCQRQAVYYTAGVGVVYTPPPDAPDDDAGSEPAGHSQHFFLGHDDDIKAIAPCAAAVQLDGAEFPPHAVFATGQVSSHTHGPYVCVWDSRVGSQAGEPLLRRLDLQKSDRGVCALGFSPDGRLLTVVVTDNPHSVYIYDWKSGRKVGEGRGYSGEPTQVFGVTWNPHETSPEGMRFATWGKKHVKMWVRAAGTGGALTWQATQLSFGKFPLQNVHSAAFLPGSGALVVGVARGELLVFEGTTAVRSIVAHRPGPQFIADDGSITYSGVRGMALRANDTELLTSGADGVIQVWSVENGSLHESDRQRQISLESPYGPSDKPPVVRALTVSPLDEDIILGTASCDVWEVNDTEQDVLIYGHAGDVHAIAWHPYREAVFATASNGNRVFVFDAACRDVIKTCPIGMALRSVAWSTQPLRDREFYHLAVGGAKGKLVVLDEEVLRPVWEAKDSVQGISDLKYNPDSTVLAAATFDQHIDLYAVSADRYQKIARCNGHSSTIRHLDWSRDGSVLQSVCSAYELLYWNGRTGRQITRSQRDTAWHSWTCVLGFPVMGIWPDNADGTDINSVDRDPSCRYVATSDDSGKVKLFNYPCVVDDAPHRAYLGHSAHVTAVRFSHSGAWLCSGGGRDRAILQFTVAPVAPPPAAAPAPEKVWGTLDATGKSYGWTEKRTEGDALAVSQDGAVSVEGSIGEDAGDTGGW